MNCKITYEQAQNYLTSCDSYSRLPTILRMAERMDERDLFRVLGEVWSLCDNISEWADELFYQAFRSWPPKGAYRDMMTPDEQAAYDALPDYVTIYRGCYKANKWGLSWSLSKEIAEKFPIYHRYRQEGQPLVVTARAKKRNIIAIKLDRNESEIITWRPKHLSTHFIKVSNLD